MHHPCPKCGAVVADTQPFCGHCRAPQIRMGGSGEPESVAETPSSVPSAPLVEEVRNNFVQVEPMMQQLRLEQTGLEQPAAITSKAPIQWAYTLPRLGVIGLGTLICMSIVPVPVLNLLFIPLGCVVAVWFQARKTKPVLPTPGQGAVLGFITSFFSFIFISIVIGATYTYQKNEFQKAIREAIEKSVAGNPDPQVRQAMQQFLTPDGMAIILALGVVLVMVVFLALGTSGGAVSAAYLRRKK